MENMLIAEHNSLYESLNKFSAVKLKMLNLALAHIKQDDKNWDNKVYISKRKIFEMFSATDTNRYSRFKKYINQLCQEGIFISLPNDRECRISIITYAEWGRKNNDDEVIIQFSNEIKPYIHDLKTNFSISSLQDIANLKGKYAIMLYKLLNMKYKIFQRYTNKDFESPILPIEYLRKLTGTEKKYEGLNFENRVIKDALNEINKKTKYSISFKKIKPGRRITGYQFFIAWKKEEENNNYFVDNKAEIIETKTVKTKKVKKLTKKEEQANEIISYLNKKINKKFPLNATTRKYILARLKEKNEENKNKYTIEDLKKVIDIKVAEWLNNEKMNKHLDYRVLFKRENFARYVLEEPITNNIEPKKFARRIEKETKYPTLEELKEQSGYEGISIEEAEKLLEEINSYSNK